METVVEKSSESSVPIESVIPEISNHGETEQKLELSPEEMRRIIEVMASTGKFWHDWIFLRGILSYQLKQVLAEYPEGQNAELAKRLDEELLSFGEGPPFTLQRLCEILLSPKSTYSNLSKLALALEKNLLVTSTLTRCTDPYPPIPSSPKQTTEEKSEKMNAPTVVPPFEITNPIPKISNGVEANSVAQPVANDGDEEMLDAEPEPEPVEEQNPNSNIPPDVEMQDEENVIREEEKISQVEEKISPVEEKMSSDEAGTTSEQVATGEQVVP